MKVRELVDWLSGVDQESPVLASTGDEYASHIRLQVLDEVEFARPIILIEAVGKLALVLATQHRPAVFHDATLRKEEG